MAKHAYVAYKLYVTKLRQPDVFLNVGNFDGKGSDLLTLFHAFLNDVETTRLRDEARERYLSVSKLKPKGRTIRYKTEFGRFGISGTLIDTNSGDTTHSFDEDESPVVETRNIVASPKKGFWAILLSERYGGRGSATGVLSEFKKAFQHQFGSDNFIFRYDGLMDPDAWAAYVDNADMTELKVKRYSPAADFADPVISKAVGRVVSHVRPYRGQKKFPREMREKILGGELAAQDIIGIPVRDGDEVELILNDGNQQRSVILGEVDTPVLAYVLHTSGSGRPSDTAIGREMLDKVADAKSKLGLSLADGWEDGKWEKAALSVKMEAVRDGG